MTTAPSERFRNDEIETALLGARVADPSVSAIVRAIATADDFGSSERGHLWGLIDALEAQRIPVDLHTITAELTRTEKLATITAALNLDALPFMRVSVARAEHYAKTVAENGRARRVARELHRSLLKLDAATSAAAFADDVATTIAATATKRSGITRHRLPDVAMRYSDHVREVVRNQGRVTGLRTGIAELDRRTGGMRPEQLIVVAGRPGMGKTSLAMKIAANVARIERRFVLVFSLEMGAEELWERAVCDEASIDSTKVHSGTLTNTDADRIDVASQPLAGMPMEIVDQGGLTFADIRGECMRDADRLGLVVIDALGLMEHGGRAGTNESTAIGHTTRKLKALAKELKVPVILLCQLNRACEEESDELGGHRPASRHLRDSGHIEQDADCVWLIYRDEFYNGTIERDVPKVDKNGREIERNGKPVLLRRANKNRAEIIITKQRGGRCGTIHVQFDAQFTRFANLEREVEPAHIPSDYDTSAAREWDGYHDAAE
jgi:replicative DNA helicase